MKLILGITNQPQQDITLVLAGGTRSVLSLSFKSQQQGWFYGFTWNGNTVAQGQRLVLSPNILRQYINQIPFGIAVLGNNNLEPTTVDALSDGSTQLYLLEGDDLTTVESLSFGAPAVAAQPVALQADGSTVVIPPASWGPAGGDLSGTYPNPNVQAFHDSTGVQLTFGDISDGDYLQRVGSSIVGAVPSGAGDVIAPGSATSGHLAVFGSDRFHIVDGGPVPGGGGGSSVYDSMTALRAAAVPANDTLAYLSGFGSANDGGGGWFIFISPNTSQTDDGGTKIVPAGSPPVVDAGGNITTPGTTSTVGFWQRCAATSSFGGGEGTRDVRWFGGLPNNSDVVPGARLALASLPFTSGGVYFPGGQYTFGQKWKVDMNLIGGGTVSIFGDGPGATIWKYAMTAADDSMIEICNGFGLGSFQDIQIQWAGVNGIYSNPRVVWIHDTTSFNVVNILMVDLIAAGSGGGVLYCGGTTNTNLTLLGVSCVNGGGTQLKWNGGSGIVNSCTFSEGDRGPGPAWAAGSYGPGNYVTSADVVYMSRYAFASTLAPASDPTRWEVVENVNLPCYWLNGSNTLQMRNSFFSGGGPWSSFRGVAVAATGSNFTITTPTNTYVVGDYIKITDASQAGLINWWKISGVTSTTITVTVSNSFTSDTVTVSSLWSCMYCTGLTESDMQGCFFNTGGTPGVGSCGMFVDGWAAGNTGCGEFAVSDCIFDYGSCAVFLHGRSNADPGSSVHRIALSNCRPNGGPRDTFGCFRVEGATEIKAVNCGAFPGNNNPPGTGMTFNSWVVSDGGQSFKTAEVSITGGEMTSVSSTALYPSATINAVVLDGANVRKVSVVNPIIDDSVGVVVLLNSASMANGNTMLYTSSAGRLVAIDATGTHNL